MTSRGGFTDSGASFEDIIFKGVAGGKKAVSGYMEIRRQVLTRTISRLTDEDDDPGEFLVAINHFTRAEALLARLIEERDT